VEVVNNLTWTWYGAGMEQVWSRYSAGRSQMGFEVTQNGELNYLNKYIQFINDLFTGFDG
jgi:hypothetical protein